jgi:hypothetical protein
MMIARSAVVMAVFVMHHSIMTVGIEVEVIAVHMRMLQVVAVVVAVGEIMTVAMAMI